MRSGDGTEPTNNYINNYNNMKTIKSIGVQAIMITYTTLAATGITFGMIGIITNAIVHGIN
jgi:hypothetical protein